MKQFVDTHRCAVIYAPLWAAATLVVHMIFCIRGG